MKLNPKSKQRFELFDGFRGLTMVSMIAYHFCYDFFVVEGIDPKWPYLPASHLWQQSICSSFILLSGFCWQWGKKHNLQRGLLVNAFGLLITVVTWLIMPEQIIIFGVLNFIGCAILLTIPAEKILQACPSMCGAMVSCVLFLFTHNVQWGTIGFGNWKISVWQGLYCPLLTIFGFPAQNFWSSDYFPIMPWIFLFWTGYFLNCEFRKPYRSGKWAETRIPVLSCFGKWSLPVYMLHQPVCMIAAVFISSTFR